MDKYYDLDIQINLFGEWSLIREWGGMVTRSGSRGQHKIEFHETLVLMEKSWKKWNKVGHQHIHYSKWCDSSERELCCPKYIKSFSYDIFPCLPLSSILLLARPVLVI